jgi:3-dehydroquinate synthase
MNNIQAKFSATENTFHIEGYEKIEFSFVFVNKAFGVKNTELADSYKKFGRCLAVVDHNVNRLYGEQIEAYFKHYNLALTVSG